MSHLKIGVAEAIGTFILIIGGPGTAVLAAGTGALDGAAVLAVALAFGFSLLVAAYAVGPVSGCHINPAVTLGLVLMRKVEAAKAPAYLLGQIAGGVLGGLVILIIAEGQPGGFDPEPENFATNLWGEKYGFFDFGAMAVSEIVLTGVLVFVVLATTSRKFAAGQVGLTVGITLALIHLISIPVDNTSVNPVRSFAVAIYAGGDALEQLWAFIVFPLAGAVVGAFGWLAAGDTRRGDTLLAFRTVESLPPTGGTPPES